MEKEDNITEQEYLGLLNSLDWYYNFSDSNAVQEENFLKDARLKRLAINNSRFKELYHNEQQKRFKRN